MSSLQKKIKVKKSVFISRRTSKREMSLKVQNQEILIDLVTKCLTRQP